MICAKAVGIELEEYSGTLYPTNQYCGESWTRPQYFRNATAYNPLTNDAQAFELLKVLSEKDIDIRIYGAERVELVNHGTERLWHAGGQTLNEAIVNACVEMMKNE